MAERIEKVDVTVPGPAVTRAIGADDVAGYLQRMGWTERPSRYSEYRLFVDRGGRELWWPRTDSATAVVAVAAVVRELAFLERRHQSCVLQDIASTANPTTESACSDASHPPSAAIGECRCGAVRYEE